MTIQRDSNRSAEEQIMNSVPVSQSAGGPTGPAIDPWVAQIRDLNDRLRTSGRGGIVQMTNGIAGLGKEAVNSVFAAVARFGDFSPDNDPWGEHDCAVLTVDGIRVIWKIDYYDRSRQIHSPDAADPKVTVRVLTVMLADEY